MNTILSDDAVDILADFAHRLEVAAGSDDALESWILRVAATQLPDLAARIALKASPANGGIQPEHAQIAVEVMGGLMLPILCRAVHIAEEASQLGTSRLSTAH